MSGVTLWHNPACGTSRNALAMIRATGVEPRVVEYLKTPPGRSTLVRLAAAVGGPRSLLREKGTPFAELGLGDPALDDDTLIDAMLAHPVLINRPLVEGRRGVVLARPSERALEALDGGLAADFVKEDGERVRA